MYTIKVRRSSQGKYYWVMYSKLGNIICQSDWHNSKLRALYTAKLVQRERPFTTLVDESTVDMRQLVGALRSIDWL
jgi:uncharacterized protein YegP (UPF0339 family)